MASLDIILNVEGTSDINALVNEVNRLEAYANKMFKAFAKGNITLKEAMASFQQLKNVNEEQTMAMDRMIQRLADQKRAQDAAADVKNYLKGQQFAIKALRERIKANEEATKAEERRNQKLDAAAEKARRRYDPIYGATKKYEEALDDLRLAQARQGMSAEVAAKQTDHLKKEYDRFVAAIKTGNMRLIDGGNQFAVFANAAYKAQRRIQKFGSSVGQQFGYQIQDFFVQIQSGTDILVAFGQQGSQLAGIFGTKGALFGAVIAIGTAIGGIAIAAYKSMQGLEDLKDTLDDLASAQGNLSQILGILEQSPVTIAENFTMAIDELQRYLKILAEAEMRIVRAKAETTISSARPFLKSRLGIGLSEKDIAVQFDIAGAKPFFEQVKGMDIGPLGAYTDEQLELLREYQRLSKEVLNAADPKQAADAFLEIEQVLNKLGVATKDLPEGFVTARDELVKFAFEYDQASAAVIKVEKALAKGIQNSTEETDKLRERIQNDRLKAERRALAAIEAARKKRRNDARKEDQKELNQLSETEKLRRRLQERSTRIIQAAEKRHRDRRRKEEEEAARLEAEGRIKAQRDVQNRMGFYQGARTGMSRAAGVDVGPTRGDITDFNNALKIRSALETAYMQDTIKREEDAQKRINGHYMVYAKSRIESDKLAEADRLAALELQGKKEQELAEKNAKYEEEQNKLRKEAREEEQRIAEAKKRANEAASAANDIEAFRLSVLEAQVKYGKDSQQARIAEVQAAGRIAEIQKARQTDDENLIRQAGELARLAVIQKHDLQDAADASKALADELERSARAMTALGNVGDSVEMALVKATAQVAALSTGGDVGVAGRIAGLREENVRAMNEAIAAGGDMSSIMAEYGQTEADIDSLAAALERLAEARGKSGKSDFEKTEDYIKSLSDQVSKEKKLRGIFGEQRDLMSALITARQEYGDIATKSQMESIEGYIKENHAIKQQQKVLEEAKRQQEETKKFMSDQFEDAFMSIIDGTKTVEDAFRDMARQIIAHLIRVHVVQKSLQTVFGIPFADGGVFSKGSVVPYASGGIVGGPTYFPMSGGRTGLMGEAGPEAIMPLKRGKGGKLGVEASGQGDTIAITQNFNFSANGDDSVKRIIASEAPKIAKMTEAQILDNRRRGGQFRKAFS